jgi:hypothetical protein
MSLTTNTVRKPLLNQTAVLLDTRVPLDKVLRGNFVVFANAVTIIARNNGVEVLTSCDRVRL